MELFETECFFVITKREMVIYTYIWPQIIRTAIDNTLVFREKADFLS